jgi:hypothetical protein
VFVLISLGVLFVYVVAVGSGGGGWVARWVDERVGGRV